MKVVFKHLQKTFCATSGCREVTIITTDSLNAINNLTFCRKADSYGVTVYALSIKGIELNFQTGSNVCHTNYIVITKN